MIDGAPSCGGQAASHGGWAVSCGGQAATTGGTGACLLNETIITYLGNLSIYNYKWFRCCGIEEGKVETRNLKVETGRPRESNPAPFAKPTPKGCATRSVSALKSAPPAKVEIFWCLSFPLPRLE